MSRYRSEKTKSFPLRTVLTVTTERLLTKRDANGTGISDLYDILGHMTGEKPATHQLPRVGGECKPILLEAYPHLDSVDIGRLDYLLARGGDAYEAIEEWLDECVTVNGLPETLDITRSPDGVHEDIDPIAELASMMGGTDKIITVVG